MPPTWASAMVCLGDRVRFRTVVVSRGCQCQLTITKCPPGGERLTHRTCQPRSVRDAVEGVGREDETDGARHQSSEFIARSRRPIAIGRAGAGQPAVRGLQLVGVVRR